MKKFFFDLHDFSDPNAAEEIEEELPPPVFNEEQLEAARREAHALGRQAGLDEAAASREQLVANMLRNISESFSKLFASEHIREKQFEQESVKLALEMLEKLFPDLNEKIGQSEIKNMIANVVADSQLFYFEKLGQGNMFSEANNIRKARLPPLVDAGHPTHEVGQSRQGAGVVPK